MKKKVKKGVAATNDLFWNDRRDMIHKILRSVGNRKKFKRSLESDIASCRGTPAQKEKAMEILNGFDSEGQKEWDRGFITIHALLKEMTGVKFGGQA